MTSVLVQIPIPRDPVSRQAELRGYLAARGVVLVNLATELGMTKQLLDHVIAGRSRQPQRIKALLYAGVPKRLLPEPTGGWDQILENQDDRGSHGDTVEDLPRGHNRFPDEEKRQEDQAA